MLADLLDRLREQCDALDRRIRVITGADRINRPSRLAKGSRGAVAGRLERPKDEREAVGTDRL